MDNFYVIELSEDFDSNINSRAYNKGERLVVFSDDKCYRVANNNMDFIPLNIAEGVYKIGFEELRWVKNY